MYTAVTLGTAYRSRLRPDGKCIGYTVAQCVYAKGLHEPICGDKHNRMGAQGMTASDSAIAQATSAQRIDS